MVLALEDAFEAASGLRATLAAKISNLNSFVGISPQFDEMTLAYIANYLLLSVVPIFALVYNNRPAIVRSGALLPLKLATSSMLLAVEIAKFYARDNGPSNWSNPVFATTTLSSLAVFCAAIMQWVRHTRSLRSSSVIAIWLLITTSCDAINAQFAYFRSGPSRIDFSLPATAAALRSLMLLLDEMPKYNLIEDDKLRATVGQDGTAGFFSRSSILWVAHTVLFGLRQDAGTFNDTQLDPEFSSELLLKRFSTQWKSRNKGSKYALHKTCAKIAVWQFLLIVPVRLGCAVFSLMQPLLVRYVVIYVLETHKTDYDKRIAFILVMFAVFLFSGIVVLRVAYMYLHSKFSTLIRGMLAAAIYKKSLRLSRKDSEDYSASDLINGDIDQVTNGLSLFQQFWAYSVETIFCVFLLAVLVGRTCGFVLLPALLSSAIILGVKGKESSSRALWMEHVQARVHQTSILLSQMTAVKMTGLSTAAADDIRRLRAREVKSLVTLRNWMSIALTATICSIDLTEPVVILSSLSWSLWAGRMTPADAFTTLAVTKLILEPMHDIITRLIPGALRSMRSAQNIQRYLCLTESPTKQKSGWIIQEHKTEVEGEPSAEPPIADDGTLVFGLHNATLHIPSIAQPVLQNVSMTVRKGDIVAVMGPNGSGKSTLLKSITGETKVMRGSRYKKYHRTAYCGQKIWLQNRSIRENIVAYSPFNARWYSDVLDACMLKKDLRQLAKSDNTIISMNGSNLSGGQRQRIALARAIYSKAPIIVLDNVLSSLDGPTARSIRCKLFGSNGILRQSESTVIFSCRSDSNLEFVDQSFSISTDGAIIHQMNEKVILDEEETANPRTAEKEVKASFNNDEVNSLAIANKKQDIYSGIDWTLYTFYTGAFKRLQFAFCFIVLELGAILEVSPALYVRVWLDTRPQNSTRFMQGYAIFCLSTVTLLCYATSLWTTSLLPASTEHLHDLLLDTILQATVHSLSLANYSHILTFFNHDILTLSTDLPVLFLKTIYFIAIVLAQLGIIASCNTYAAIVIPVWFASFVFLRRSYIRILRKLRYLDIECNVQLQNRFKETANGLEHIRAFGWDARSLENALRCLDASQRIAYSLAHLKRWLNAALEGVRGGVSIFLVVTATYLTYANRGSSIGPSLLVMLSFNSYLASAAALIEVTIDLELCLGALRRIRDFVNNTPCEKCPAPKDRARLPKEWPQNGRVVMTGVSAKYSPSKDAPLILKDISLTITPGQKIGIVGRTGSGKTSLLMTMLSFLEYNGTIELDGIDIAKVSRDVLRASITTVSQDSIEFDNSVRFNLCPWTMNKTTTEEGNVKDEDVVTLLKELGLWQLIHSHGGLDARMRELGLSPGQKQLMCVARACLHKLSCGSRLVIMDESTSELEVDIIEAAKSAMDKAFGDCTVITVAHLPEVLENMDMIVHIDNGRIVRRELPGETVGAGDSLPAATA